MRTRAVVLLVSILILSLACQQSVKVRRSLLDPRGSSPAAQGSNKAQGVGEQTALPGGSSSTGDSPAATAVAGESIRVVPPPDPTGLPNATDSAGATAAPPQPSEWAPEVDAALRVLMNKANLPLAGLSAAVRVGSQPPVTFTYGKADIDQGLAVGPDTPFQIASITKQFTAAAILRLVEAGGLNLDDPAVNYFPDLPEQAKSAAQGVTIRHLLTHTSGLPDPVGLQFRDFTLDQDIPDWDSQIDLAATFGSPNYGPGLRWSYNNTGYWILGRIVEIVSGQSYGDYLQSHFFTPLGMAHTRYCASPRPGEAVGYDYSADSGLQPVKGDMRLAFSAGGLCSTPSDLLAWQQALESGQVVSPESYQQMITPVTLNNGSTYPYGFGLNVKGQGDGLVISHGGLLCGFQSTLVHYAQGDVTIAVLINTDGSQAVGNIANRIILPIVRK